jgi:hypothetical protein
VELDIRRFETTPRAEKPAGPGDVGGERPTTFSLQALGVRRRARAEQALGVGMPAHPDTRVILQALAYWQIDTDGDHQPGEVGGRADLRKHEQLRRIVGAGGQDDLRLGVDS